jgi:hypothetical protein
LLSSIVECTDGTWVGAPDIRQSINPATYEVIGEYTDGGLAAAQQAVDAARRAFRETSWPVDHELHTHVLGQLAEAFEHNRHALLDLLATENGKVKAEAAFELDMVPPKLRYYAAAALLESGRDVTLKPGSISLILRQPMGVAGIITPREFARGADNPFAGAGARRRLHRRHETRTGGADRPLHGQHRGRGSRPSQGVITSPSSSPNRLIWFAPTAPIARPVRVPPVKQRLGKGLRQHRRRRFQTIWPRSSQWPRRPR